MDLNKLSTSDKIISGAGIVLLIDLLLLPWHDVDLGFASATRTAIQSPNGFWGLIALLLTAAVVGVTLVRALKPETSLPEIPISWNQAVFYACVAIAAVLLLKLVIETDFLGFGAYLGVLLAGGVAYGGFLKFQEDKASDGSSTPPTV